MTKNEIIEKLKPRCNGYDLPLSLNLALVAEILTEPSVGENAGLPRVSNPVCPKCKSTNNTGLTYDDKYCCLDCSNLWANDC